jgi:alpha-glucoside transport system substrate-binding protein
MTQAPSGPTPLLALVLLLASITAGVGCSTPTPAGSVTVLAVWTGTEADNFKTVLAAFTQRTHIQVDYRGTRALNEVLLSSVERRSAPDIAVSSPGELARYQHDGDLRSLDDLIARERADYADQWLLPLTSAGRTHVYAVPLKANLKTIVWFDPKRFAGGSKNPPTSWDDLLARGAAAAAPEGAAWCVGLGDPPNSGWPGTDWIKDILLRQSGAGAYQALAAGTLAWTSQPVIDAWRTFDQVVTGSVRGGARAALLTSFGVAGSPMFSNPPGCYLEHQASFAMGSYKAVSSDPKPGADFDFFPFPPFASPGGAAVHQVVSVDLATMFNGTPQARLLMQFLATPEAQGIWPQIPGGGAFSVNRRVPVTVYPDSVSRRIATVLTSPGKLCFDASDAMPPIMRDAFYRAVEEYLSAPDQLGSILNKLEAVRIALQKEPWPGAPCGPPPGHP